jgi:hypothetical protein
MTRGWVKKNPLKISAPLPIGETYLLLQLSVEPILLDSHFNGVHGPVQCSAGSFNSHPNGYINGRIVRLEAVYDFQANSRKQGEFSR